MSIGKRWRATGAAGVALVAIAALAMSGSAFGGGAQSCGTVILNEQSWVGSTANTYVAKYVLEERLGCKVKITRITEGTPYFQAMRDGKVDVALEDWDNWNEKSAQPYIKDKSVRVLGPNGVLGLIGWYIPTYVLKQNPSFKTWRGLKGKESVFKSPESGSQGMFLGGDPSYQQKDKKLIEALGLDLKHVVAGAEPAQVARWTQLYKQRKPVLFYWYEPQYLNLQYDLYKIKLPPVFNGCLQDEGEGGPASKYRCDYAPYVIDKLISGKFATSGSPALKFIRKWKWTNADQELVSKYISGDRMKPEKAAEKWVKANAAKVNAWLK